MIWYDLMIFLCAAHARYHKQIMMQVCIIDFVVGKMSGMILLTKFPPKESSVFDNR